MFDISLETIDDVLTVKLSGEFIFSSLSQCKSTLATVRATKAKTYIADVTKLTMIDSSGMGVLISLSNSAVGAGTKLRIRGATGQVADILKVTKFSRLAVIE